MLSFAGVRCVPEVHHGWPQLELSHPLFLVSSCYFFLEQSGSLDFGTLAVEVHLSPAGRCWPAQLHHFEPAVVDAARLSEQLDHGASEGPHLIPKGVSLHQRTAIAQFGDPELFQRARPHQLRWLAGLRLGEPDQGGA